ncbi:hypothetical protein GGR07_000001 [Bacteroides pyogenes]|nr:hypothetical protein [Bacteroides pyogenes]SUV33559.1 Uncharacterised protein [Bacteroides pyogenes]
MKNLGYNNSVLKYPNWLISIKVKKKRKPPVKYVLQNTKN